MFNPLYVKDLVTKRGLTYKDVSVGSGINENTFKSIMSSKSGNPSASNIEVIADFLECSIDDFFDRKWKPKKINNEEKTDSSILLSMYKEKDAEASSLKEEVGRLKERLENLTDEITLRDRLSRNSFEGDAVASANAQKDVPAP